MVISADRRSSENNTSSTLSIDSDSHQRNQLRRLKENSLKIQYEAWENVIRNIRTSLQSLAHARDEGRNYSSSTDQEKARKLTKAYNTLRFLDPHYEHNVTIEEVALKVFDAIATRTDLSILVGLREKAHDLSNDLLDRNEFIASFEQSLPFQNVIDKFRENLSRICNNEFFIDILFAIGNKIDEFIAQDLTDYEMANKIITDYISHNNIQTSPPIADEFAPLDLGIEEAEESLSQNLSQQGRISNDHVSAAQQNISQTTKTEDTTRVRPNPFIRALHRIRNFFSRHQSYDVTPVQENSRPRPQTLTTDSAPTVNRVSSTNNSPATRISEQNTPTVRPSHPEVLGEAQSNQQITTV